MASGQRVGLKQGKRHGAKQGKSTKRPLAAHRAFAPMLGAWGALLGGLTTMAVAPIMFTKAVSGTLIATLGIPSQPAMAALAAVVFGAALFSLAKVMHRRAAKRLKGGLVAQHAGRRVRPIDPQRDLGSKSLDDPLEAMPFATPAWRDADIETGETAPDAVALPAAPAPEPAPDARVLDFPDAGRKPGRSTATAEGAAPAEPGPARRRKPAHGSKAAARRSDTAFVSALRAARPQSPRPAPGTAALSRLRALPPSELSLLEMVERFAGALHEHRAASPAKTLDAAELAAREAALAEALRALAALSADTAARTEQTVRAAPGEFQAQRRMERGVA